MIRSRWASLAAVVALVLPATAYADTFWDFVALNGSPASEGSGQVTYSSRTVTNTNPLLGSVNFTGQLPPNVVFSSALVTFRWFPSEQQPNDEKGVGVCRHSLNPNDPGPCYEGGEVGEAGSNGGWLILDLTGLVSGSILKSVTIASLDFLESYYFEVCTSSAFTTCSAYGAASNNAALPNIWVVNINAGDQSRQWIRFKPGLTPAPAYNGGPGGYVVQGITTDVTTGGGVGGGVVPEPGTMGLLATGLVALAGVGAWRRRTRRTPG